ncbi:MAG: hypothetical protein ACQKBU_03990 [Verrucomicrobiales bacterium]
MKPFLLFLLFLTVSAADDAELAEKISQHQRGAEALSDEQDELAADVQQLILEQTDSKVIELFEAVEEAMDEASELLYDHDTRGPTIAAETDVIEKIYEAAQEKQKQAQQGKPGEGDSGSAMMDMLGRMLGKEPGGKPGQQPGNQGGEGQNGDSSASNETITGASQGGSGTERVVPKGAGTAGRSLPREYLDALKAYNRGAEKLTRE